MTQTIDSLTADIGRTIAQQLGADLGLLRGYSRAKAGAIAAFTLYMGEAYAAGRLSEAELVQELEELDRMVARFVRNIEALAMTLVARLVRAIGALLLGALDPVLGPAGLTLAQLTAAGGHLMTFRDPALL